MDMFQAISDLVVAGGVSGSENAVGETVKGYFRRYTKDVWSDTLGNVFARVGDVGPTVLIMAHMDEIGMMVTDIEENGMLRICSVAGVDTRVLPGSQVCVYGREALPGVIGAVPPHLLTGGEKGYKINELICDIGYPPERVRELVSVGDFVSFDPIKPLKLKNGVICSKTLDDRAQVACLFQAMEHISRVKLNCTVVFCASVQEERGSIGASIGTYGIKPDMGIAIDVTHAPTPGVDPLDVCDMDKIELAKGGNIHPKLHKMLLDAADQCNIPKQIDACMGFSGTDGWSIQVERGGVPTALLGVPVRYMHTSVETLKEATLKNCARLLAQFIANINEDWEDALCLDN